MSFLRQIRGAELDLRHGHYERAERTLRQALRPGGPARQSALVDARAWNLLGVVRKHRGRFVEAKRAYLQALRILDRHLPSDHVAYADLCHNLAGLDFSRGRLFSAERSARRGLAIRERCIGIGHYDLARDRGALGAILSARKRHRAALKLLFSARRSFASSRGFRGKRHDLAVTDNNIAAALHALRRFAEAERYYLSAITLKRRSVGPRHPDVGLSLHNLVELYREWNPRDRAIATSGTRRMRANTQGWLKTR